MNFTHRYARTIAVVLAVSLLFQLTSCGTLIYSERQNQPRGKIDPTVAILDGIGLLFFIIPGLVAFAVDFHTNAIYLPPEEDASNKSVGEEDAAPADALKIVPFEPGESDVESIEKVISNEIGHTIRFGDDNVQAFAFSSAEELTQQVARVNADFARRRATTRASN